MSTKYTLIIYMEVDGKDFFARLEKNFKLDFPPYSGLSFSWTDKYGGKRKFQINKNDYVHYDIDKKIFSYQYKPYSCKEFIDGSLTLKKSRDKLEEMVLNGQWDKIIYED